MHLHQIADAVVFGAAYFFGVGSKFSMALAVFAGIMIVAIPRRFGAGQRWPYLAMLTVLGASMISVAVSLFYSKSGIEVSLSSRAIFGERADKFVSSLLIFPIMFVQHIYVGGIVGGLLSSPSRPWLFAALFFVLVPVVAGYWFVTFFMLACVTGKGCL